MSKFGSDVLNVFGMEVNAREYVWVKFATDSLMKVSVVVSGLPMDSIERMEKLAVS